MQPQRPLLHLWSKWQFFLMDNPCNLLPSEDCLRNASVQRAFTQTVKGHGARVRPKRPCMDGADLSSGNLKVKACIRLVNIRNSSILASCSPMHTLRPAGYIKHHLNKVLIAREVINIKHKHVKLLVSRLHDYKHTYSKWNKAIFPEKFSLFIQKSAWIEVIRIFPHGGIPVYWPEVWDENCSFRNSVSSEL